MDTIMLLLRILLIMFLIVFVHRLIDYIKSNRAIEKTAIRISKAADEKYNKRKEERERIYLEEGNQEDESFFYRLDLIIERSGLRYKFKNLTTEIYLTLVITLTLVGFIVASKLGGILLGVAAITVIIVFSYGVIYILSSKNHEKIDDSIIPFINLLENYATSDSDIVNIMGNVCQYLEDPLRSYIEEFCDEAITSGNPSKAFMNLEVKIANRRLKSIIRNLEICSKNEANYDVIIQDERRALRNYSKSRAKKKELFHKGRSEVFKCLLINAMIIIMFSTVAKELINGLLYSRIGNVILLCWIIVLGMCAWYFIEIDKGER